MAQGRGPKLEKVSVSRRHGSLGGARNVPETAEEAKVVSTRRTRETFFAGGSSIMVRFRWPSGLLSKLLSRRGAPLRVMNNLED